MTSPGSDSQSVTRLTVPKALLTTSATQLSSHRRSHPMTSDRRRGFRTRGLLGATVASAPSVEHEDYRTPRPADQLKNGKSFDYDHETSAGASDSNPLLQVSADFLRLYGNRQQFRNLLTARRKLGALPPAYTRIDDEPVASGSAGTVALSVPESTVSSELQFKLLHQKPSICTPVISQRSVDTGLQVPQNGMHKPELKKKLSRAASRYGVRADEPTASYRIRSQRLRRRVELNDRCVILAVIGIVFMIVDNEITGQPLLNCPKESFISLVLRWLAACSTLLLLTQICLYHINEIKLEMFDCGADDWRVVASFESMAQIVAEIVVCSICPLPGTGYVQWTFMESSRIRQYITTKQVPVDVILSLLMLSRAYLIARFMVLHSKQFQDASTRTLAALNRIQVNFSFVTKTILDQHPIAFLTTFTVMFWVSSAWTFAQCERYGREERTSIMYSNALWFIAITFMLNGYGDIVPHSQCGRTIAITVGVVGATVSSILIAVISRKILLSEDQRNVNNFMNDSKLTKEHKHAAARVLQYTWHIYRCLTSPQSEHADSTLRDYQRKFLRSIHSFRHVKNKIRVMNEDSFESARNLNRMVNDVHIAMQRLIAAQEEMKLQFDVLQRVIKSCFGNQGRTSIMPSNE